MQAIPTSKCHGVSSVVNNLQWSFLSSCSKALGHCCYVSGSWLDPCFLCGCSCFTPSPFCLLVNTVNIHHEVLWPMTDYLCTVTTAPLVGSSPLYVGIIIVLPPSKPSIPTWCSHTHHAHIHLQKYRKKKEWKKEKRNKDGGARWPRSSVDWNSTWTTTPRLKAVPEGIRVPNNNLRRVPALGLAAWGAEMNQQS